MSRDDVYARIAEDLDRGGWSVCPHFLDSETVGELAEESRQLWESGGFRQARVGTGPAREVRTEVRNDFVHWLEPGSLTPAQRRYFDALECLRLAVNRRLYLGLFEFEGHLTVYPPKAFYRKHLDQFRHARERVVTCILYLNPGWDPADGGCLRGYPDPEREEVYTDVPPDGGTLVVFLCADFFHEVQPAKRERMSLTGWFRVRK